jgi:nucleoside-diphosphate-sugar epimerase
MKVHVTGGAGGVGRWVVRELLARGHQVTAAGRTPGRETVEGSVYEVLDCLNYPRLRQLVSQHEAVIHLAGIPSLRPDMARETFEANCMGTFNVFEACVEAGIPRIAVASSINALGQWYGVKPLPVRYFPIDEDHPQLLSDPYSFSKKVLEDIGEYYWHRHGIHSVSLRITWVINPWRGQEYVNTMRAYGPNVEFLVRNYWTWVDSRDSARAFVAGIEADYQGAHKLFINSDQNIVGLDSRALANHFFPEAKEWREDIQGDAALVSCRRAKEILGWEPIYRLRPEDGWNLQPSAPLTPDMVMTPGPPRPHRRPPDRGQQ